MSADTRTTADAVASSPGGPFGAPGSRARPASHPRPAPPRTDAQVVVGSVDRPAEFAELFDRHAPAIHRYLARRGGAQLADDLVASTYLVAFERRSGYDPARPDALPWLYGIASNLLARYHREEKRRLRAYARTGVDALADDGIDRVLERTDAEASVRSVAGAVAELSAEDRDVLLLFAWAELTYAQIAEAVDVPVGTVRSRLNRARRRVRAALSGDGPRPTEESYHD